MKKTLVNDERRSWDDERLDRNPRSGVGQAPPGAGHGPSGEVRGPWGADQASRRADQAPWCADEEGADVTIMGPPPDGDDLPIHPIPDEPRKRRGPFGISTVVHIILITALILQAKWMPRREPPKDKPQVTIEFLEPTPEPTPPSNAVQPPAPPKPKPAEPKPAEPKTEPQPITPPPAPKVLPPPTPLPPPTRMGELVPIPHYPVPGTVPPEDRKSGKPGPPAPETDPEKKAAGDPNQPSETDKGAGDEQGAGAGVRAGSDTSADNGVGAIAAGPLGGLEIPKPGRGKPGGESRSEGGGRRHGISFELPPESGAFGDFQFEDKDFDWSDYYSQMYYSILRTWYNRLYVMTPLFDRWCVQHRTRRMNDSVLVRFVIERSGEVSSIEILEPSKVSPLDESARSALKEVILPRLPESFPKDREGVTGRFIMEVSDVEGFKEALRWEKMRGSF